MHELRHLPRRPATHSAFLVDDNAGYYLYSINTSPHPLPLRFSASALPGTLPGARAVISAVSRGYHGEVAATPRLSAQRGVAFTQPAQSVVMVGVPRVPTREVTLRPAADAFVRAGRLMDTQMSQKFRTRLAVQTSPTVNQDDTAVALLSFDPGKGVPGGGARVVSAVLRLHVAEATSKGPQVLAVLGFAGGFPGRAVTWSKMGALLNPQPNGYSVVSIGTNFVNWRSATPPIPVGYITVPPATSAAGAVLALDVTDYVKGGAQVSFAVVRMHRFDARGQGASALPGEKISGAVSFHASASGNATSPGLDIVYQVDSPPPPAA
jgi:hypothetical protein